MSSASDVELCEMTSLSVTTLHDLDAFLALVGNHCIYFTALPIIAFRLMKECGDGNEFAQQFTKRKPKTPFTEIFCLMTQLFWYVPTLQRQVLPVFYFTTQRVQFNSV